MASAKSLYDAEGFEWGAPIVQDYINSGQNSGGSAGWTSVVGQWGRAGKQAHASGSGWDLVKGVGADAIQVARIYFGTDALPSSGHNMPVYTIRSGPTSTLFWVVRITSAGYLEAGYGSGTSFNADTSALSGSQLSKAAITTNRWYRLDLYLDCTTTTWTLKWQLGDGATTTVQTDASLSGSAGQVFQQHMLGWDNGSYSVSFSCCFDDWAIGATGDATQYPLGPGKTVALVPSAGGTHVNPSAFQNDDGTAIDSTSVERLQDYASYDQAVAGQSRTTYGDGRSVEMLGPFSTANWLEFLMQTYTLASGEACSAITGLQNEYQRNGPLYYLTIEYWTDLGEVGSPRRLVGQGTNDQLDDLRWASGTTTQPGSPLPPPSGGWTQTRLDNLKFRFRIANSESPATGKVYGLSAIGLQLHLAIDSDSPSGPTLPLHIWSRA